MLDLFVTGIYMGIPLVRTEALFSMHISFDIKEQVYEETFIQCHQGKSKNAVTWVYHEQTSQSAKFSDISFNIFFCQQDIITTWLIV